MKSLVEKRREQQEKRWQIYKADNFIEDQQQEEEEEILSDPVISFIIHLLSEDNEGRLALEDFNADLMS